MDKNKTYPQVNGNEYPIDKMSLGYLKTQLEKITRTGKKAEYKEDIEKQYNAKKPAPIKKVRKTKKNEIFKSILTFKRKEND